MKCAATAPWMSTFANLYLSRYVSFHDEVRMPDLARAFEEAIRRELRKELEAGRRFVAITHSTGGPVVRDWWDRYYVSRRRPGDCPMSHLIMLAPANFGSALAQLGASRISRLKSWFEGVEPGTGVLEWLELGSAESWDLNTRWLAYASAVASADRVFPFVLTGQSIDRSLYDHLNSYTGEIGSDGVVRAASANPQLLLCQACSRIAVPQEEPPAETRGSKNSAANRVRDPAWPGSLGHENGDHAQRTRRWQAASNRGRDPQVPPIEDAAGYRKLVRRVWRSDSQAVEAAEVLNEREPLPGSAGPRILSPPAVDGDRARAGRHGICAERFRSRVDLRRGAIARGCCR